MTLDQKKNPKLTNPNNGFRSHFSSSFSPFSIFSLDASSKTTIIVVNYNKGLLMHILSLSEAKMKLSQLVETLNRGNEEITLTKNGRPVAVLVTPQEFESWRETLAIERNPELMAEIRRGVEAFERGEVQGLEKKDLDDLLG